MNANLSRQPNEWIEREKISIFATIAQWKVHTKHVTPIGIGILRYICQISYTRSQNYAHTQTRKWSHSHVRFCWYDSDTYRTMSCWTQTIASHWVISMCTRVSKQVGKRAPFTRTHSNRHTYIWHDVLESNSASFRYGSSSYFGFTRLLPRDPYARIVSSPLDTQRNTNEFQLNLFRYDVNKINCSSMFVCYSLILNVFFYSFTPTLRIQFDVAKKRINKQTNKWAIVRRIKIIRTMYDMTPACMQFYIDTFTIRIAFTRWQLNSFLYFMQKTVDFIVQGFFYLQFYCGKIIQNR